MTKYDLDYHVRTMFELYGDVAYLGIPEAVTKLLDKMCLLISVISKAVPCEGCEISEIEELKLRIDHLTAERYKLREISHGLSGLLTALTVKMDVEEHKQLCRNLLTDYRKKYNAKAVLDSDT